MPSRNEQYLEAAVNKSGTDGLPEPRTRNEKLLHRLVEEVSSGGLPEGGSPYQQLVTDGNGNAKWEDRLAYDDSKLVVDVGEGAKLIKVADEVPSWATVNAPTKLWLSDGTNHTVTPEEYTDLGNGSFAASDFVFFIATDNIEIEFIGIVFPEKGVYFLFSSESLYVTGIASADSDTPEITWDSKVENVKTIDPKYIKDMYYEGENVLSQIDQATIDGVLAMTPYTYTVGKPYTVIVNGVTYETTCHVLTSGSSDYCLVGLGVYPPTDDIPFCLSYGVTDYASNINDGYELSNVQLQVWPPEFSGEIKVVEKTIKQIDPKYIKDMYYTQTIPGSDGPIITFQAYLNTVSPLTLSEPLIVDAPYTVNVGDDKCKTTCTTDGEYLFITVPAQGTLVVDDPINNPLIALWNGAVTNKNIEIVRESQEEVKQIDPKYIPPTMVIVNIIPNKDGTFSADKTYMEVKELIDNGVDVKCVSENIVIPILAIRDTAYIFAVEYFPEDFVLTVVIFDGGCEVMRNRPSDAISDLIDAKLGVIENGSY